MHVRRWSLYAALAAACVFAFSYAHESFGQTGAAPDRAAGRMVDSLFEPNAPESLVGKSNPPLPPRRGIKRPTLQAKLVRNSNPKDGAPPFAMVDRYGGILRYIEPVDRIKLEPYVGRIVKVRHDTGDTLLASQLIFPPLTPKASAHARSGVQQVAFQEPIPAGEPAEETLLEPTPADAPEPAPEGETYTFDEGEEVYMGEGAPIYEDGAEYGDCPDCIDGTCSLHMGHGYRPRLQQPGFNSRAYLHGEYLLWWFDGMDTPPLVTESDPVDRAVLPNFPGDNPSTETVYGDDPLLEDARHGFRVLLGVWLDEGNKQALEADYLFLGEIEENFSRSGTDGNPLWIGRPFFDLTVDEDQDGILDDSPREAAEQVSSNLVDGTVSVYSSSEFQGAGLRLRHNLCRSGCTSIGCGDCVDCGMGVGCGLGIDCGQGIGCGAGVGGSDYRYVDVLTGVRWYQLRETLEIREALISDFEDVPVDERPDNLFPQDTEIDILDQFSTENNFVGGELGFDWGIERNRLSFNVLSKIAIGNNSQEVSIFGQTEVTEPGQMSEFMEGGLLALPRNAAGPDPDDEVFVGNIGEYDRDRFSMIPELNFNVGYKLTQQCKLRVGYTIMYWTNVLRPGDQIDRELNSSQIPSDNATALFFIPSRPQFAFNETNVLIQGLNIGAEYCW